MRKIADGLWQLSGFPPHFFNVYLAEDMLIDAATRWAVPRVLRQLRGRAVRLVALTHCHPDHQGAASAVCRRFGAPLACHEADAPAAEGSAPMLPENWLMRLGVRLWSGPPCPVRCVLRNGDKVGGFRVIHTPGHTPGHVIYFRDADRVVVGGDLLANASFLPGRGWLREPPMFLSADPEENRRSVAILADLNPKVVCFGHGPPLRDPQRLKRLGGGGT